jgi:hypothetical protein
MVRRVGWIVCLLGMGAGFIFLLTAPAVPSPQKNLSVKTSPGDPSKPPAGSAVGASAAASSRLPMKQLAPMPRQAPLPATDRPPQQDHVYDTRTFERMSQDWGRERDDPDWSTNTSTFIQAMLETMEVDAEDRHLDGLSVRCRTSVCRVDARGELVTLSQLLDSSRDQQDHVTFEVHQGDGDSGMIVEAYVARELAEPPPTR